MKIKQYWRGKFLKTLTEEEGTVEYNTEDFEPIQQGKTVALSVRELWKVFFSGKERRTYNKSGSRTRSGCVFRRNNVLVRTEWSRQKYIPRNVYGVIETNHWNYHTL